MEIPKRFRKETITVFTKVEININKKPTVKLYKNILYNCSISQKLARLENKNNTISYKKEIEVYVFKDSTKKEYVKYLNDVNSDTKYTLKLGDIFYLGKIENETAKEEKFKIKNIENNLEKEHLNHIKITGTAYE